MCFVWISEQTAIISLYNINWLVFIADTQCVYRAVRTVCLHIIDYNLRSLISADPVTPNKNCVTLTHNPLYSLVLLTGVLLQYARCSHSCRQYQLWSHNKPIKPKQIISLYPDDRSQHFPDLFWLLSSRSTNGRTCDIANALRSIRLTPMINPLGGQSVNQNWLWTQGRLNWRPQWYRVRGPLDRNHRCFKTPISSVQLSNSLTTDVPSIWRHHVFSNRR